MEPCSNNRIGWDTSIFLSQKTEVEQSDLVEFDDFDVKVENNEDRPWRCPLYNLQN